MIDINTTDSRVLPHRILDEYRFYTEDEKDCQMCLTRGWNHCRISRTESICCPPNNETGPCTKAKQVEYFYCSDFVRQSPLKRFTCPNRYPCNQNNTIYHMKHYLYDVQSSKWGFFSSEWKRYCSFIIQANSSLEGNLILKVPLIVGSDFYVVQMPKD